MRQVIRVAGRVGETMMRGLGQTVEDTEAWGPHQSALPIPLPWPGPPPPSPPPPAPRHLYLPRKIPRDSQGHLRTEEDLER